MCKTAKQLRELSDKANLLKRRERNRKETALIKDAKKEAAPVLKQILQEIGTASRQGKYHLRIAAIRVGINDLSELALMSILRSLEAKEIKTEVNRGVTCDTLGLKTPANHDIEGWEEYYKELDKRTKYFIEDIVVSW